MNKRIKRQELKRLVEKSIIRDEEKKRIRWSATSPVREVLLVLNSSLKGLDDMQIQRNRMIYGKNQIEDRRIKSIRRRISESVNHPVCSVLRKNEDPVDIPQKELVVGDIICITQGETAPADLRVIMSDDLMVDQAFMTGDERQVRKNGQTCLCELEKVTDYCNIILRGTHVTQGAGEAVVISVGSHTILETMN